MNKRIKELVAQLGGIGYNDDGNELTPALVGKDLAKFAELIVRECMSNLYLNGYDDAMIQIQKHFGVEE
jgi:hypothetical protein